MNIGIETHTGLVYEGGTSAGRSVWPTPVITPARFAYRSEGGLVAAKSTDPVGLSWRFREDSFDPIARVRRGRFYFGGEGLQPTEWRVHPHPAMPLGFRNSGQFGAHVLLETFASRSVWHTFMAGRREHPLVLLGLDERSTVWIVLHVEPVSTGEELVTLKARSSLGILPILDEDKVPEVFRERVVARLEKVVDEAHRAAPDSVIDRAREAATDVLLAHLDRRGSAARDLRELCDLLGANGKNVVAASAGRIIARLHARGKAVEQERNDLRPIREHDADLAVQCLGALLCEVGWADWD